jgi:Ca2+-binding RTX toxin-like protein
LDAPDGVTVSLALQGSAQNTVAAGIDRLTNMENLIGSLFSDTLRGDANANILSGVAGNDVLVGAAGNDTLIGLTGNDTLYGGAGNDSMDGGAAGSDTASYADATAGVRVNLAITTAQNTIGAGTDTLLNFENLAGSNFNDTLSGNGVANILNGGAGNDTLIGAAGNDAMNGGAGNDSMDGGAAGTDTVTYSDATAGVTVNLALGTAQNTVGSGIDTLFNFENLTGSNFNDKLTGNAAANTLYGLGGNDSLNGAAGIDILSGAAGNDRLIGGAGNDSLDGGVGTDSFVFDKAFGKDSVTGFVATGAGHDTIDFSTAAFANFAAIKSHMVQSGANVIITLDSADTITVKNVTLASLTAADFTFHPGTAPAAPMQPAASPWVSPDSPVYVASGMASIASDHSWLDHSAHSNSLTLFG